MDVYELKAKALKEKIKPGEIYKCLVHTCNHRGYQNFYEDEEDEKSEEGVNKKAASDFSEMFLASKKETVSEFLLSDFKEGNFVKYRNTDSAKAERHLLIERKFLIDEAEKILRKQGEFYPCLNNANIESAIKIIFAQRDFEDGPGDTSDNFRRYMGFLAELGKCPFYPEEQRGFRSTVISDIFAVANVISQYNFIEKSTGEFKFDKKVSEEIVKFTLENGKISVRDVENIAKKNGFTMVKSNNSDSSTLTKAVKYLNVAKKAIESAGENWDDYISEEQFDPQKPSKLHRIGEIISKWQTPRRRKEEFEKEGFSKNTANAFSGKKISGTGSASYKYMCEFLNEGFLKGEIYGNFQADKNLENEISESEKYDKLPPSVFDDEEIKDNPVVFRSINEVRKTVNAIIDIYGQPSKIIIEVADELGKSYKERKEQESNIKKNEKENDNIRKEIAEILNIEKEDVKIKQIEKYKLYKEQNGKCLYSGEALGDIKDVLNDTNHMYETDHIVPYSLILDNTLNNKALVYARENQLKGQQTPLMYLKGERKDKYSETINFIYQSENKKGGKSNRKKYEYLRLETIYGKEAEDLLNAWKSRNINDTRYITKFIALLFEKYLRFNSRDKKNVFAVKGKITSKYRKIWLADSEEWGKEEKNRANYLNHAVDAVIIANLSLPYIEIASDFEKLTQMKKRKDGEYLEYLEKCKGKMRKYYGFDESYTERLLKSGRVPSYVKDLPEEIKVRFETDETKYDEGIKGLYGECPVPEFKINPSFPIASLKPSKRFRGCIADDNPLKIVEKDGENYKAKRKKISELTSGDIEYLYTENKDLKDTLKRIFEGKDEKYTVAKYLEDNGLKSFKTDKGQPVFKVTVMEKTTISNYYKVEKGENNFSILGSLKYYCIEVYKTKDGKVNMWGLRYIDIVKKNKKLYLKEKSLPEDYAEHIMYLFKNDFIEIFDGKGKTKFKGYYQSVAAITRNSLYFRTNESETKIVSISSKDKFKKYSVSILGKIGGEIKCSEPLSLIKVKE